MVSIVRISDFHYRMFVKGAPEILLHHCTHVVEDVTKPLNVTELTSLEPLTRSVDAYATKSLRTIALVYRDFPCWPPVGARVMPDEPTEAIFKDVFHEMVFLGVVGIRDPVRLGVKEAVAQCQHAGIHVRMVTGDSVKTAVAVARECGICTSGGRVIEGPTFRKLSSMEMNQILPDLQVLARSSPEDKRILVKKLKELGETVAVTGDGTNDGPALKTADVGFSMGITGTEVAKEASSIVLMDDNFASIVKALAWGRTINDAVKKFLQVSLNRRQCLRRFTDLSGGLVSTYCEHHGGHSYIRVRYSKQQGGTNSYSCAVTLGKPDYGYVRCISFGNRPACSQHTGQKTGRQIDSINHADDVENDYRASYIPIDCDAGLELRWQ
jgi:Ca2+-transporting ATPase